MGAKRIFLNVNPEYEFVLRSGQRLRNVPELLAALKVMGKDEFEHHVNTEKNDFFNWVRDVVKDQKLANDISRTKSQNSTIRVMKQRLKGVSKKNKPKKRKRAANKETKKRQKRMGAKRVKRKKGKENRKKRRKTTKKIVRKKARITKTKKRQEKKVTNKKVRKIRKVGKRKKNYVQLLYNFFVK